MKNCIRTEAILTLGSELCCDSSRFPHEFNSIVSQALIQSIIFSFNFSDLVWEYVRTEDHCFAIYNSYRELATTSVRHDRRHCVVVSPIQMQISRHSMLGSFEPTIRYSNLHYLYWRADAIQCMNQYRWSPCSRLYLGYDHAMAMHTMPWVCNWFSWDHWWEYYKPWA